MRKKNTSHTPAPVTVQPDETAIANRLTSQYRRTESAKGAFVREAVAFGVMMMQAEREFSPAATAVATVKLKKRGRFFVRMD